MRVKTTRSETFEVLRRRISAHHYFMLRLQLTHITATNPIQPFCLLGVCRTVTESVWIRKP